MKLNRSFLIFSLLFSIAPLWAAATPPSTGNLTTIESRSFKVAGVAAIVAFLGTVCMDKADYALAKKMLLRTNELTTQGVPYPDIKATITAEFANATWWQKAGWYAVAAVWAVVVLCAGGASWSMLRRGNKAFDAAEGARFEAQAAPLGPAAQERVVQAFIPPVHRDITDLRSNAELMQLSKQERDDCLDQGIALFSSLLAQGVPRIEAAMALSGGRLPTTKNTLKCYARMQQGDGLRGRDVRDDVATNLRQELDGARSTANSTMALPRFLYGAATVEGVVAGA